MHGQGRLAIELILSAFPQASRRPDESCNPETQEGISALLQCTSSLATVRRRRNISVQTLPQHACVKLVTDEDATKVAHFLTGCYNDSYRIRIHTFMARTMSI